MTECGKTDGRRAEESDGRIPAVMAGQKRGIVMKSVWAPLFAVVVFCACAEAAWATQETRNLARERKMFRNFSGEGSTSISSLCVEGHGFVLVSGNQSNQNTLTQVYEEREGKVLPKRCEADLP